LTINFEIQYFFNTFNTAWEPWGGFRHRRHRHWVNTTKSKTCVQVLALWRALAMVNIAQSALLDVGEVVMTWRAVRNWAKFAHRSIRDRANSEARLK